MAQKLANYPDLKNIRKYNKQINFKSILKLDTSQKDKNQEIKVDKDFNKYLTKFSYFIEENLKSNLYYNKNLLVDKNLSFYEVSYSGHNILNKQPIDLKRHYESIVEEKLEDIVLNSPNKYNEQLILNEID